MLIALGQMIFQRKWMTGKFSTFFLFNPEGNRSKDPMSFRSLGFVPEQMTF